MIKFAFFYIFILEASSYSIDKLNTTFLIHAHASTSSTSGNGLFASKDLEVGEVFLRVPLMYAWRGCSDAEVEVYELDEEETLNETILRLILCFANDQTMMKEYSHIRPPNLPIFWKNVQIFNETSIYPDLLQFREFLRDFSVNETFARVASLIISRIHFIWFPRENKQILSIIPVADLLNTALEPNCNCITDSETEDFVCMTNIRVKKGEELYVQYGPHEYCDGDFLLTYGFLFGNRPCTAIGTTYSTTLLEDLQQLHDYLQNINVDNNEAQLALQLRIGERLKKLRDPPQKKSYFLPLFPPAFV